MILCSTCQHPEMVGAIFCSECGAPLVRLSITGQDAPANQASKQPSASPQIHTQPIWLKVVENQELITLTDQDEITLGRAGDNQSLLPDIDLSMYHAYERGVSRIHATISYHSKKWLVKDLDSSNGTLLNGNRIPARIPQPLSHGDIITLGKLELQILFHPSTREINTL
jgi:pSer/pThr/pTyr-binding forkhead associated (FHA) protein